MRLVRATVSVDPEEAPAFFNLLANSPDVEEARILEVNTTIDSVDNLLIEIDGDPTAFAEGATETPGVESVDLSETVDGRTYALVVMRPLETPLYDAIHRASALPSLVVRTPILYRDGKMIGRAVGDPEPLQRGLDAAPDSMDVRIDEIGRFRGELDDPSRTLSERQREALAVAHEVGYYDHPRQATQEDVARRLDCAPATAGDHLQKAEAKIVRAVLDEFGPGI